MSDPGQSPDRIAIAVRQREAGAGPFIFDTDHHYALVAPLNRGHVKVEADGRILHDGPVGPGMLRLQFPGERVWVTRRSPATAMLITVPERDLHLAVQRHGPRLPLSDRVTAEPFIVAGHQVEQICRLLLSVSELDRGQRQLFVDGLTHALLAIFLSLQGRAGGEGDAAPKDGLSEAQFARCVEFAESCLGSKLDLGRWAAAVDMAAPEFARRFRQKTGLAPYSWFMNWRIDRSKAMLLEGRPPTAQIALDLGFSSQSHFTEAFRRRVGMSPGRWRMRSHSTGS